MTEESYPNFKTLCRLCLQARIAEINIFQKENTTACQLSIPVRIMACAALEVQSIDGLPKSICAECRYQLEKSYYFRKRCQLSDSRLKKHLRLLNLGKKSRIFNRTEEDNLEDELEFVDSLDFIREQDANRAKREELKLDQWKDDYKERIRSECLIEVRAEVENKVRNELKFSVVDEVKLLLRSEVREEVKHELRNEVWQEVKNEIRREVWNAVKTELWQEVATEVRENIKLELRDECLVQAKFDLRNEVKEECREEEMKVLLEELGDFFKSKCLKKQQQCSKNVLESDSQQDVGISAKQKLSKNDAKPNKAMKQSTEADRTARKPKVDVPSEGSTSVNEISSTEQAMSLMVIENEIVGNTEDENESNFFIIEDEEEEEEEEENATEQKVQDAANTYFAEDESGNCQASESSEDSTTYQIEENGDIKFFKKEMDSKPEADETEEGDTEQNILIFGGDFEQDESGDHIVQFVDMTSKKEIVIKRTSDPFSSSLTVASPSKYRRPLVLRTNDVTKTFQCSDCPQLFATENSMYRHMMMHKKLEKKGVSYQCSNCHVFFSCKSSLNRHMLKHTGRRPFACEECGKSFIQREILKRHLLTHSGVRPYECPHCDRSFVQKLNLKQHIDKLHTDNPKVQQYPCHLCPKRFNHASGLSRHLATHSGVAFQCPECERTFSDRSSVKRHILHMHKEISSNQTLTEFEIKKNENSV